MRVLLLGQKPDPTSGGAYYLQRQIMATMVKTASQHQFFFLSTQEASSPGFSEVVSQMNIDFIWTLAPYHPDCKVPYAITVWDIAHRVIPYFPEVSVTGWKWEDRESLYRHSLPRAAMVITGTERGKFELERAYGLMPENIKTIPFPITRARHDFADDQLVWEFPFAKGSYLFYPAQFWPHKNHIVIIKALKLLKAQGVALNLVLTGSDKGNAQYIKDSVAAHGLQDAVHFPGFVSDAEIHMLYRNAVAMVYASLMGPLNLPPIEAMALDCPVVCADTPGMRDQLGDAALFFAGTDAQALAEQILAVARSEVRSALAEKAAQLLIPYTPEAYAAEVLKQLDAFALIRECWGQSYVHT